MNSFDECRLSPNKRRSCMLDKMAQIDSYDIHPPFLQVIDQSENQGVTVTSTVTGAGKSDSTSASPVSTVLRMTSTSELFKVV